MEQEGRGAIIVGGVLYPGFSNVQKALEAIREDSKFQGALVVELGNESPKSTFKKDFPFLARIG